ncbi:nuclear transport factor 2 family protein [Methylocella sp. CPCC 101449]|jgi:hypothetical protein|uniref:nuclear transport factor 2 family protein n=1 Tax=Methylocella sp. CPCC 101449 TaxID=2987531 RepID=UPI00288CA484|nr:nuclear transport factor 2 family protein [Methylocella sp. CPCC 101449]MDT2021704.1 nuclear transport factor 2 family protein [Methylocella sp. CPCC 101449]HEV2571792.1 nuclear transport factor 2 family protein [Beijerinckiaceae bacterium]
MTDFNQIADRYLASWNERDAAKREAALAGIFTADASFVDPVMQSEGLASIAAMIGQVQERFPGHNFKRLGEADGYNNRLRFTWELAAGDGAVVKGTDVATLDASGKVNAVIGFFDFVRH